MLNLVYRTVGVWGFPFLPLITISFEKCIYDSVRSLQGYDPTIIRESRKCSVLCCVLRAATYGLLLVRGWRCVAWDCGGKRTQREDNCL